jgi:hypothetical protein
MTKKESLFKDFLLQYEFDKKLNEIKKKNQMKICTKKLCTGERTSMSQLLFIVFFSQKHTYILAYLKTANFYEQIL